jgi:7-cyano-7-deazaguanine synthase
MRKSSDATLTQATKLELGAPVVPGSQSIYDAFIDLVSIAYQIPRRYLDGSMYKGANMQRKAFVLLSGGMDSTTCLYKAIMDYAPEKYWDIDDGTDTFKEWVNLDPSEIPCDWVEAVSINYGQRHTKELEYARATCDRLGVKHTILDVGNLLSGKTVMLTNESVGSVDVPDIDYADIKGVSPTYVPFRNGLMLSALTAHAQKYVNAQIAELTGTMGDGAEVTNEQATEMARNLCGIYFGAHSEDAANWAYPDCTPEFIGAMANAIYIGSYMAIRLHTPIQWLMKHEIVTLGDKLGVPFETTWSCYKGEEHHCGTCPTCRSRKQAFEIAHVVDPTVYAYDEARDSEA